MSTIEILQLNAVENFTHSVQRFCECIEQDNYQSADQFVRACAATLASVYADALALPDIEPCEDTLEISDVDSSNSYVLANKYLKKLNGYSLFFSPYDEASATMTIVGDDLADIYQELRQGLEFYRPATDCAIREALFHWKFGFETHWGRHLVSALTALHAIIAGNLLANDE